MSYDDLQRVIAETPIFDSHEHFLPADHLRPDLNLFTLMGRSYLMSDLISAGMPPEAWGKGSDTWRRAEYADAERIWEVAKRFLPAVRESGFFTIWQIILRDLYGVADGEFTDENWRDLSERIAANYADPEWMNRVLADRAGIRTVVLDNYWQIDDPAPTVACAVSAVRANTFIYGPCFRQKYTNNTTVEAIAESLNVSLGSVRDYYEMWEKLLDSYGDRLVAVKIATAYERDLQFDEVPDAELPGLFDQVMRETCPPEARRRFQDAMFHHAVRSARDRGLPVQVHGGLFGGNANLIANGSPLPLCSALSCYPDVRFSLLHMAWPFADEAIAMGKMFPNLYLDFSWHSVHSPDLFIQTLKRTLGTVPTNKLTWGADTHIVEEAYAASQVFRGLLERTLTDLIPERGLSESRACDVARMLLHDNAAALFGLTG